MGKVFDRIAIGLGIATASLVTVLALASPGFASTPANITNTVGVCDPLFPQRCTAPSVDSTTGAAASGLVVLAQPGTLYEVSVTAPASAGFVCVIDAAAVPADGAVAWEWGMPLAANAGIDKVFNPALPVANGAVVVFSSSACPSITKVSAPMLSGQAK